MTAEKPQSLQDVLDSVPNLVDHLYGNRKGSVLKDAVLRQPTEFVAPEFTTWRDEQVAWREGIAFYDQSFHMTTTYLRGPGALPLISRPVSSPTTVITAIVKNARSSAAIQ